MPHQNTTSFSEKERFAETACSSPTLIDLGRSQQQISSGATPGKFITVLGWLATASTMAMYFSYIYQIRLNLHGAKGSAIQPGAACASTLLWAYYGYSKEQKDWPLICANLPGILLSAIACLTAL